MGWGWSLVPGCKANVPPVASFLQPAACSLQSLIELLLCVYVYVSYFHFFLDSYLFSINAYRVSYSCAIAIDAAYLFFTSSSRDCYL